MNLQSSTLEKEETGEPFHIEQAAQIRPSAPAWKEAGHKEQVRGWSAGASSRWWTTAIAPISAAGVREKDQVGFIDEKTRAIFGRSYAAEPDLLVKQLKTDEAVAEADTRSYSP